MSHEHVWRKTGVLRHDSPTHIYACDGCRSIGQAHEGEPVSKAARIDDQETWARYYAPDTLFGDAAQLRSGTRASWASSGRRRTITCSRGSRSWPHISTRKKPSASGSKPRSKPGLTVKREHPPRRGMSEQQEDDQSGFVIVGALLAVAMLWFACSESADCRKRGGVAVRGRFGVQECLDVQRK
jgi:hypothetical protein